MTSKHDKSENELRYFFLFPCPSTLGLLMWLTSFPFLFVWSSRRESSFPSSWEHFPSQVWAGKAEPAQELLQWPEDFTRSPWEHRALAGPARPVWCTGWSAAVVLEAQSGFIKSADVAVMDPPGWVLSWSLVWLSWISYGNCISCACLACGLGQMNK